MSARAARRYDRKVRGTAIIMWLLLIIVKRKGRLGKNAYKVEVLVVHDLLCTRIIQNHQVFVVVCDDGEKGLERKATGGYETLSENAQTQKSRGRT